VPGRSYNFTFNTDIKWSRIGSTATRVRYQMYAYVLTEGATSATSTSRYSAYITLPTTTETAVLNQNCSIPFTVPENAIACRIYVRIDAATTTTWAAGDYIVIRNPVITAAGMTDTIPVNKAVTFSY